MRLPRTALAVLGLLCGGCDFYYYRLPSPDDLWRVIPWFNQMIHARYIRPYETDKVPRYTPEGTVPVGAEPDWSGSAEASVELKDLRLQIRRLRQVRMDRVVRRRSAGAQDAPGPPGVVQPPRDLFGEQRHIHIMAA